MDIEGWEWVVLNQVPRQDIRMNCDPEHVSAKQRFWYKMALPAPVEWHRHPVVGSLLG